MAEERVQRKLTTILAADVEGYSRLMSVNEEATLKTLNIYRKIIDELISRHGGRIFGAAGDSVVAEFGSTVEAVRCAIVIQEELRVRNAELAEDHRMRFRIGVNVGDVMVEGVNLFGDGVNVAARLEGLAEAGGICISGSTLDQVKNKLSVGFADIGAQELKNIPDPVPVFRVVAGPVSVAGVTETPAAARRWRMPALMAVVVVIVAAGGFAWWQPTKVDRIAGPSPYKPSIAVLPFVNMSDDKKQKYFSDGISEDIITDLSKVSGLVVIAWNSSFKYEGESVDVRDMARDLGVRHVLKGSVRRVGEQLRITVQLVDATTGNHIWAERYNRGAKDIFAIQDEIATKVAAELAVTLKADEQERLYRRYTNNLEAYDAYLRVRRLSRPTRDANQRAKRKRIAERIIKLDPDFAGGYALLSYHLAQEVRLGQSALPEADIERALMFAQKAVATDDTFGPSYESLGNAYLMKHKIDKAVAAGREAVRLLPGAADAYRALGYFLHWAGRGDEAIDALKTAARLDPKWSTGWLGYAYVTAGRYDDAISTLNQGYELKERRGTNSLSFLAAAYIATGQDEKARAVMNVFLEKHPKTTLSNYRSPRLYKRKKDLDRYLNLLRKAGMPE